jgi:type I restriction enzyme S subunit
MGELLRIRNGKDHKHLGDGEIPVWGTGGIMRYADEYFYSKPSVLIPRKGSLGNLFYTEEPFWTVDTLFYTEIDESLVFPKYVYRFLQTQDLAGMNEAGGVPSLTQTMLNKIQIPVPEIAVQKELVHKIDCLDELISGTTSSLPTEIDARRKQYEYYRDKLLTFKELAG